MPQFDRAALESLMMAVRPELHRYCARMVGSVIDGEDVVQDTLVKALRAVDAATEVLTPERWIFCVAHNAALDHLRRCSRESRLVAEADIDDVADPTGDVASRVAAASSLRSFMHLPLAHRSAVILADVLGLSLQEVCGVTGATPAATKAHLHRGRSKLRRLAEEPDGTPPVPLGHHDERRLRRYIDLFNARDFDGVRALIAEDIRVDVVNRIRLDGRNQASTYYGNYERADDWALALGFVERRPAILSRDPAASAAVRSFMLLEWRGDRVAAIRDFRYAPYCVDGADIRFHEA